jgi:putative GTP pyrophosphokinase
MHTELAHDRSFKFGAALPTKMQRKLNLYAGMLEIADSAFDEISHEVDAYSRDLDKKSIQQIADLEINELSITKLVAELAKTYDLEIRHMPVKNDLIGEIRAFGLSTIGDLDALVDTKLGAALKASKENSTTYGVIRSIMMYTDLKKYLTIPSYWSVMTAETANFLSGKYGSDKVVELVSEANKTVSPVKKKKSPARKSRKPRRS